MPQIFANIFSPWGEMKQKNFRFTLGHLWHQFFSTWTEIENFAPGRNFMFDGARG